MCDHFFGKTRLLLEKVEPFFGGDVFIMNGSLEQYPEDFKTEEENKEQNVCGGSFVVFDGFLVLNKKKTIDS